MAIQFLNTVAVDTDVLYVDTTNNRVGIGTTSPSSKAHIIDTSNPNTTSGSLIVEGRRDGGANVLTLRAKDASNPSNALPNGQGVVMRFQGFDGTDFENMGYIFTGADGQAVANSDAPSFMSFGTSADGSSSPSERMRIDSSGNVGIGVSPSYPLHVGTSGAGIKGFFSNNTDADLTFNLSSGVSLVTPTTGILAFGTSGSERMRIDSSGNVGIGTTSPQSGGGSAKWLSLNGTAAYSGGVVYTIGSTTKAYSYFESDYLKQQAQTGFGQKFIVNGNNTAITILSNGNVGIGTASPSRKLVVSGAADGIIQSNDTAGNGSHLRMLADVTAQNVINWDKDTALRFATSDEDWANYSERMRITSTGNVGIGTTSPTNVLHAHSDTDNDYVARFEGSTNNTSGVWTGIGIGGESNNTKSAIIFEDIGLNYSRGKLHLAVNNEQNQNSATKADARLTVNNNGNVGIGITSPTNYKLEVNGSVRGDSFGTDQNTTARIFAPSGAAYNGNS